MNSIQRTPKCDLWVLSSVTSGLRVFQLIGLIAVCTFLGWVGAPFTATYGVFAHSIAGILGSICLLCTHTANLPDSTPGVNWILWELLYTTSFSFLGILDSSILLYSSFRWHHTSYWLASLVSLLTLISFLIDLSRTTAVFRRNSQIRYSTQYS